MTRVAVANVQAPFIRGGAEVLADSLVEQFRVRGVDAHLIRIPFAWNPPERIIDHVLATRLLRLGNIDRLIPLKFPAYSLQHENKVVWLLHQFRQAYDLWGTPFQGIPDTPEGAYIRQLIHAADALYLSEAKRIYTNSATTQQRLMQFNGMSAEVLYPPLQRPEIFYCESPSDYLFYPSRISPAKRQTLVVEAMAHVKRPIRLVLAGPPDTPADLDEMQALIARLDLADRVELHPYWISEERKADLYARSVGVVYTPLDEDSYGYVTLESFEARKPVITCDDSGGTLQVVVDEETGYVVAPDARALGDAINTLAGDIQKARGLGENGLALVRELGISWDRVIEELLR